MIRLVKIYREAIEDKFCEDINNKEKLCINSFLLSEQFTRYHKLLYILIQSNKNNDLINSIENQELRTFILKIQSIITKKL